ncbi:MAG: tetratricopeptide repeat protein [Elusimicrobia bacterium]|nr:tetratricopeptide repeat protein [Candidatus Liberimonas magnetica]
MKKIFIFLNLFFLSYNLYAGAPSKIRSGNAYFKKGDFQKSLDNYREAQINQPDNPAIHFNIGDSLYKMNQYDQANNEFNKAAVFNDKKLQSRVYYNLGNSSFRENKYDQALDYYKKAIELNPDDAEAKYNFEYVKRQKLNPNNKNKKDEKKKQEKDNNKQAKQNDKEDKKNQMSKEDAQRILQYFDQADRDSAKKRKMKMPQMPKVEEDW